MDRWNRLLALVAILGIWASSGGHAEDAAGRAGKASEQAVVSPLHIILSRVRVTRLTVPQAFGLLADRLQLRCSVEEIAWPPVDWTGLEKRVSLDLRDVALADVLNHLVLANPAYAWEQAPGGIIRLFPASSTREGYPLARRLAVFRAVGIEWDRGIGVLGDYLRAAHVGLSLQQLESLGGPMDRHGDPVLLNVVRHDVSPREVMDLLTDLSGDGWAVVGLPGVCGVAIVSTGRRLSSPGTAGGGFEIETAYRPLAPPAYEGRTRKGAPNLELRIRRFKITNASVPDALVYLAFRLHFEVGIEVIPDKWDRLGDLTKPVSLDVRDSTLGDVFDLLVRDTPYRWSDPDGLAWFHPGWSEKDAGYLLHSRIPEFSAVGVQFREAMALWAASLRKQVPRDKFLLRIEAAPFDDVNGDPVLLNLRRHGATARDLLNLLTSEFECSWIISPYANSHDLSVQVGPSSPPDPEVAASAILELQPAPAGG